MIPFFIVTRHAFHARAPVTPEKGKFSSGNMP